VHETFGWIGQDIEDGSDPAHTGGTYRLRLDLARLETVATRILRGNRALTRGIRQTVSGNHQDMWSPISAFVLDGRSAGRYHLV
jgi:hypothetical protein